jgi:hypothetical protein
MDHHHTHAVDSHGTVYQLPPEPAHAMQAPEIDPSGVTGAGLLLVGAIAVILGRR